MIKQVELCGWGKTKLLFKKIFLCYHSILWCGGFRFTHWYWWWLSMIWSDLPVNYVIALFVLADFPVFFGVGVDRALFICNTVFFQTKLPIFLNNVLNYILPFKKPMFIKYLIWLSLRMGQVVKNANFLLFQF